MWPFYVLSLNPSKWKKTSKTGNWCNSCKWPAPMAAPWHRAQLAAHSRFSSEPLGLETDLHCLVVQDTWVVPKEDHPSENCSTGYQLQQLYYIMLTYLLVNLLWDMPRMLSQHCCWPFGLFAWFFFVWIKWECIQGHTALFPLPLLLFFFSNAWFSRRWLHSSLYISLFTTIWARDREKVQWCSKYDDMRKSVCRCPWGDKKTTL